MRRIIILSLFISFSAFARPNLYKELQKPHMKDLEIQKIFGDIMLKAIKKLKTLKPNVPSNSPLFEYYVGIEVSLNTIYHNTFTCNKKDDMRDKLLFYFDPKYRKIENMPDAVLDLIKFLDTACSK